MAKRAPSCLPGSAYVILRPVTAALGRVGRSDASTASRVLLLRKLGYSYRASQPGSTTHLAQPACFFITGSTAVLALQPVAAPSQRPAERT